MARLIASSSSMWLRRSSRKQRQTDKGHKSRPRHRLDTHVHLTEIHPNRSRIIVKIGPDSGNRPTGFNRRPILAALAGEDWS
jgi:hypothetical protein